MMDEAIAVAIEPVVSQGKERGYVTYAELDTVLPANLHASQIEDVMTLLIELGINLIESRG